MSGRVVTQAMIERGLAELGLPRGGIVLVHSSLSSFGRVAGGADCVIDALLNALGPEGTLCMPALSYGDYGPANPPPLFDPKDTPCIVGRIPETFRRRPGVLRSLHPTHSIAAIGPAAADLLANHERSRTPCGPESPWGKLVTVDGQVLMIGCGTAPMTLSHGPEEILHEDARCTPPVSCRIKTDSGILVVSLRLHAPGATAYKRPGPQRRELESVLEQRGQLRRTRVGESNLLLMKARDVWDTAMDWCGKHHPQERPPPAP